MKEINIKTLWDSGLVFEINRSLLHPLGYSLVFKPSKTGDDQDSLILMRTADDEGVLYFESDFMDGAAKFSLFMRNIGEDLLRRRLKTKGFLRQTRSDQ